MALIRNVAEIRAIRWALNLFLPSKAIGNQRFDGLSIEILRRLLDMLLPTRISHFSVLSPKQNKTMTDIVRTYIYVFVCLSYARKEECWLVICKLKLGLISTIKCETCFDQLYYSLLIYYQSPNSNGS